jgi:predicted ATP-grasp superfamily ATP-dependent carboligase
VTSVFVYEYISGGGTLSEASLPAESLRREGGAMLRAAASDFQALPDVCVTVLHDARWAGLELPPCEIVTVAEASAEQAAFQQLARRADWTLVIAPEFRGILRDRCRTVAAAGGKLLSPGEEFVAVAADKPQTVQRLAAAGIPVPQGVRWDPASPLPRDFPYPAVLKPADGAGSLGVQWIDGVGRAVGRAGLGDAAWLERYCPGLPASVAVLCGPAGLAPLPACRQRLSDDGRFRYLGGEAPLAEPLTRRAQRLAVAAATALPPTVGYVGVDLVLGEADDGKDDVVIEVNPRLTTSYVGLRRLVCGNLAAAMLAAARGQPVALSFAAGRVVFDADGTCRWMLGPDAP